MRWVTRQLKIGHLAVDYSQGLYNIDLDLNIIFLNLHIIYRLRPQQHPHTHPVDTYHTAAVHPSVSYRNGVQCAVKYVHFSASAADTHAHNDMRILSVLGTPAHARNKHLRGISAHAVHASV